MCLIFNRLSSKDGFYRIAELETKVTELSFFLQKVMVIDSDIPYRTIPYHIKQYNNSIRKKYQTILYYVNPAISPFLSCSAIRTGSITRCYYIIVHHALKLMRSMYFSFNLYVPAIKSRKHNLPLPNTGKRAEYRTNEKT